MITKLLFLNLICFVTGILAGNRRRGDPLDSCTQTDPALLDACVASAIAQFTATYMGTDTSSFDYTSVASEINSIESGLTSFGLTVTSSVPDPATFTGGPSVYSGPHVSDIVSSYSEYSATHTGSSGSVFSFDTSSFVATRTTSTENAVATSSPSSKSTITAPPATRSSTTMTALASSTSTAGATAVNARPVNVMVVGIGTVMVLTWSYLL